MGIRAAALIGTMLLGACGGQSFVGTAGRMVGKGGGERPGDPANPADKERNAADSAQGSPQEIVIGSTKTRPQIDLLVVLDNSKSMQSHFSRVRDSAAALVGSLSAGDSHVQVSTLNMPDLASVKSPTHDEDVQRLSPVSDGYSYNSLTVKRDASYAFYGDTQVSLAEPGSAETLRSIVEKVEIFDNGSATQENGLCSALLGYQSVFNTPPEGFKTFRKNADSFVAVVISDEEASLSSCQNLIKTRVESRAATCDCYKQKVGTETCVRYGAPYMSCTTDDAGVETCTESTSCEEYVYSADYAPDRHGSCTQADALSWNPAANQCLCSTFAAAECRYVAAWSAPTFDFRESRSFRSAGDYVAEAEVVRTAISPHRSFKLHFVGYNGPTCTPTGGGQSNGKAYGEVADATGGKTHCINEDMSSVLSGIAQEAVLEHLVYTLDSPNHPVVAVSLNGEPLAKEKYIVIDGRIRFAKDAVSPGDKVVISYGAAG